MMLATPVPPTIPDDETAARTLSAVLNGLDVTAFTHQDRSPWGVRIPLTDDDGEHAPALYVLTENEPVSQELGGRKWFGQLGGFPDELQSDLYDTIFEWCERSFNDDGVDTIATAVRALLPILQRGVA